MKYGDVIDVAGDDDEVRTGATLCTEEFFLRT
jgi:hypothetical protein